MGKFVSFLDLRIEMDFQDMVPLSKMEALFFPA
jgi:hypothetical protein